ncbi:MAG: NmrA family NAD(P)-binding protein [Pseudomonadota bacterium]|nr:NmrA family NAD(P)-binding protein [Pseudomonadota bacterium]
MNILITGATGNIGREVIKHFDYSSSNKVIAAVQNAAKCAFAEPIKLRVFDFHDVESVRAAMHKIDVIFLLRPPQIADVGNVFTPIIDIFKSAGIKHVVFLSVQGAENNPIIPHYKIERMLRESGIPHTFIRPSYFMQNLTTTLRKDVERGEIYLPSGKAKFNWVDAADIGRAVAVVLKTPKEHRSRAYVITGSEQLAFKEVAEMISHVSGKPMHFKSPSLPSFFFRKKREGERTSMIFVLIMLHFFPRFSKPPPLSDDFKALTGREPGTLEQFINREMMGI